MVLSSALAVLAALLLGFVADVALLGGVRHARDQELAFAQLRLQLASGTAPLGPVDSSGTPLMPGAPVTLLEVPSVGIREVVGEGTTASLLRSGPGHRRDTVLPGQVGTSVVLGRLAAFGGPFRKVARLRLGQQISATTGQGRFVFTVVRVRRAGDAEPPPLAAGAARLTLVTASGPAFVPDGALRVDADLMTPGAAAPGGRPAVTLSEAALAPDDGALVPLMLWTQALLLLALGLTWARHRWGRWQSWLLGAPLLMWAGVGAADQAACLLPNLL